MAVCYGAAAAALRSFFKPGACFFERDERMDMCLSRCDMAFSPVSRSLWLPLSRESRYHFFAARILPTIRMRMRKTPPKRLSITPLEKFEISVPRKTEKTPAAVPQLGLYATAADIHGALDALERKKAALLDDLTAAGEVEKLSAAAA